VNDIDKIRWQRPVPGAAVFLWPEFLRPSAANFLLNHLLEQVPWRQDHVVVYGKRHKLPRLHQWYGDPSTSYRWSGLTIHPSPWTEELEKARQAIQVATGHVFNSVLLNYYRDGSDTVGWHADDEPELGEEPVIASVTLGCARDFSLRLKSEPRTKYVLCLPHGSLFVMAGDTQRRWEHSLPRRKRVSAPRVSLTFRRIHP